MIWHCVSWNPSPGPQSYYSLSLDSPPSTGFKDLMSQGIQIPLPEQAPPISQRILQFVVGIAVAFAVFQIVGRMADSVLPRVLGSVVGAVAVAFAICSFVAWRLWTRWRFTSFGILALLLVKSLLIVIGIVMWQIAKLGTR